MNTRRLIPISTLVFVLAFQGLAGAAPLKVHGVFSSNMVLQRDKPIMIWGWAQPGEKVSVQFGEEQAEATAGDGEGRWEATFPARGADAIGRDLTVSAGDQTIGMTNIVVGDVWVMNGQSNMAFEMGKGLEGDLQGAQAHLPLLRELRINPNEHATLQTDLPGGALPHGGWIVATPQTAGGISAIGYAFGARVQRALQVPIGLIDNARGGASIESLVPRQMFKEDPLAARYLAWVDQRRAEFDWDAALKPLIEKWEKDVAEKRKKGVAEDQLPPKPTRASLRSWSVPGKSPSDAASCYNGMFGVFKGLNIKGVVFNQGYNNAMGASSRPKRYRVLMRLMVQGWREDFNDTNLPVAVIGLVAGGISQTRHDFEVWSVSTASYIREAQRLGLADVGDPEHTAFIAGYDNQIPGLHPRKKMVLGVRAARWALKQVYGLRVGWETAKVVSAKPVGDRMLLTFDRPVMPDDLSMIPDGFSIADESGKFYMAYAAYPLKKDVGIWNTANKCAEATKIYVWSPLVKEPVAVRYAWARSPMGNLKVDGKPWQPLPNFRTDAWDWPESEDPAEQVLDRGACRAKNAEAAERCEFRRTEEARNAVEILEQLKSLRKTPAEADQQ